MAFMHRRPSPDDLNALFASRAIQRTHKAFKEQFGGRYKLGQLAALVPGITDEEVAAWRKHLDQDLPRTIREAIRAVVRHALGGKEPIPIRFEYRPARSFEVTISERVDAQGAPEIYILLKGSLAPAGAAAARRRSARKS